MSCEHYKTEIADAVFATTPGREVELPAELAAHVEQCPGCRKELESQRRLAAAIDVGVAATVAEEPSPAFAAGVRARIAQQAEQPRGWLVGWWPVTASALAVMVVFAVLALRRESPPPPDRAQGPKVETGPSHANPLPPGPRPQVKMAQARSAASTKLQMKSTSLPEVLVPPDDERGIAALYAAMQKGRVDAAALATEPPGLLADAIKPLEIPELKIAPLEAAKIETEGKSTEPESKK